MTILTRKEVAEKLKVSIRTLEKWALQGNGPEYCKLNGAVRYTEEQLEAFINSCRCKSTSDGGEHEYIN